jgi:hypothetical protein
MRWVGAVLAALTFTGGTASAAAPLAGVTMIQADSPGYIDVVVPKGLHFFGGDFDDQPRPVFDGDGAVIVLALRSLDASPGEFGRDHVHFEQFGPPDRRAEGASGSFSCPCDEDNLETSAGLYRLYLLSDKPVRARLRLPELDGKASLEPTHPAAFETRPLGVFEASFPDTAVLGAWGAQSADGGEMAQYAWFDAASSSTLDRSEICFLSSGETESGSEFGPGCSGSAPDPVFDVRPLGDGSFGLLASYSNFPAGRYGLGVNLTHLGEAVPGGGVAFWAGFNDEEPVLPDTVTPAAGRLSLVSSRARVRRNRAAVRMRCAGGPCHGALAFAGARRPANVTLRAGRSATVRLAVPARLRRALRRRSHAAARLVLRTRTPSGVREAVLRLTLVL